MNFHSLILDLEMHGYGRGYCSQTPYAGSDGQGEDSEEECKNVCLREEHCTFVSYYNAGLLKKLVNGLKSLVGKGKKMKICKRYKDKVCQLLADTKEQKPFKTFIKKGLF